MYINLPYTHQPGCKICPFRSTLSITILRHADNVSKLLAVNFWFCGNYNCYTHTLTHVILSIQRYYKIILIMFQS